MINIGGKNVAGININNKMVIRVQDSINLDILWENESPANEYFFVENEYNGENTISVSTQVGSGTITGNHATSLEYSRDKETWHSFTLQGTKHIYVSNLGERIYFRNSNGYFNWFNDAATGDQFVTRISCSYNFSVGGNINTLLDYTNRSAVSCSPYCFYRLFINRTNLIRANNLYISSRLDESCCYQMFSGCTSLVTPPVLTATTLAVRCYEQMFYGCTALTSAPTLLATTLANYCCQQMFYGCSSLVNIPSTLPATTLASGCYSFMFGECTSLMNVPILPSTNLAYHCYDGMFYHCTSLENAPALPATTLANGCYRGMFEGCTTLAYPPYLNATTLVADCYREMFIGCTSLNTITTYADDISAINCLYEWFKNAASTGIFHNLGSATYPSGSSGIPNGWTEVHYE